MFPAHLTTDINNEELLGINNLVNFSLFYIDIRGFMSLREWLLLQG